MNNSTKMIVVCLATVSWLAITTPTSTAAVPKWPKPKKGIKVFSPPEDLVVPTNGAACFTVVAEASNPLKPLQFHWRKNDTNIAGATDPSLLITNVQLSDVGFYSCLVRRGSNGPSIIVRSIEPDTPGARLFVYTGTNTAVTGPYQPGTGSKSCIGSYLGRVTFKVPNTTTTWFSRPTGTTNCTITDTSTYGGGYVAKVEAVESYSLWSTCAVHTVTFPTQAPPQYRYQFTTFVISGPPPSGSPLTLDIHWQ